MFQPDELVIPQEAIRLSYILILVDFSFADSQSHVAKSTLPWSTFAVRSPARARPMFPLEGI